MKTVTATLCTMIQFAGIVGLLLLACTLGSGALFPEPPPEDPHDGIAPRVSEFEAAAPEFIAGKVVQGGDCLCYALDPHPTLGRVLYLWHDPARCSGDGRCAVRPEE